MHPYESFIEIPSDIYDEITIVARDFYKRIEKKFKPDGISFMQNNGAYSALLKRGVEVTATRLAYSE